MGVIIMMLTLSAAQIGDGVRVVFDQVAAFWVELAFVALVVAVATLGWLLAKQRRPISELEQHLEIAKGDLRDASEEIGHLTQKLTRTQREARSSLASFAEAQAHLEQERRRTKEFESDGNALRSALQRRTKDLQSAKAAVERMKGQLKVADAKLTALKDGQSRPRVSPPATSPPPTGRKSPSSEPTPVRRSARQGRGIVDLQAIALEQRGLRLQLVTFNDLGIGRAATPMALPDARRLHSALVRFHIRLQGDRSGVFTIPDIGHPGKGETVDLTADQALFLANQLNDWMRSTGAG